MRNIYKEKELPDEKREKNNRRTKNQSKNNKRKRVNSVLSSVRALSSDELVKNLLYT